MENRQKEFQKNFELEKYLEELNGNLECAERQLLYQKQQKYPVILVMGALRSGTTLTMQWLANTKEFAYPTNIMSRFYKAPIIGAKIQKMLFDPKYNFRNEIIDFNEEIPYISQNGKTQGALSPNEFWFFWRRFFPYEEQKVDYLPDEKLEYVVDREKFLNEIYGIADVFQKPVAMKGLIANYNIGFLDHILKNVVFLYIKREPCSNIASVLEARKRQHGNIKDWYSFRIPEMEQLMKLSDPVMQAAGQVYFINQAIERALKRVSDERKMEVQYEQFCENPEKYYHILWEKLNRQGYEISKKYFGESRFEITRKEVKPEIERGYSKFVYETLEHLTNN